ALKIQWISALAASGLREIEIGSFVPAKLLPQMADAAQLVTHARTLPGLFVTALVPNLRGAQAAFEAGVQKITLPISVSEPHSLANIRKTHAQVIEEVRSVIAWRDQHFPEVQIEAGLSTVFGCTLQGVVPADDVIRMALKMAEL